MIKHNLTSKNTIRQFPALLSLSLMAFFLLVAKELDSTQSYYHYLKLEVCKEKQIGLRDFFGQTRDVYFTTSLKHSQLNCTY